MTRAAAARASRFAAMRARMAAAKVLECKQKERKRQRAARQRRKATILQLEMELELLTVEAKRERRNRREQLYRKKKNHSWAKEAAKAYWIELYDKYQKSKTK